MADLTGSPVSPADAEPAAAGAFVPDVAEIQRLANAFFHGLSGGAPLGAAGCSGLAAGAVDRAGRARSAACGRCASDPAAVWRGGPSGWGRSVRGSVLALSAAPRRARRRRSPLRNRARLAPAASQTSIAAPRVDPLQAVERPVALQGAPAADPQSYAQGGFAPGGVEAPAALSPFAAPLDLSAALAAFAAATGIRAPRAADAARRAFCVQSAHRGARCPVGVEPRGPGLSPPRASPFLMRLRGSRSRSNPSRGSSVQAGRTRRRTPNARRTSKPSPEASPFTTSADIRRRAAPT